MSRYRIPAQDPGLTAIVGWDNPDILDRMEMVGLKSGMRIDRFDRFGKTLRVIREGCSDIEAEVFALLQKLPGFLRSTQRTFHNCLAKAMRCASLFSSPLALTFLR